jgi:hypothetical protein
MSRRDHDDLDDADDVRGDYPPDPPRKRSNTGLIIGLVIGGAVLVLVLVCGGLAMFGWLAVPR